MSDLHTAWARLFAESLKQCGVGHAVISPGSRSTPLALALARVLPVTVLHDERTSAFFALGQGRASGRPSVVLATSGTAPGHWLPAAMEAREAGIPLLLLSADRPWEVQDAQASQTVDQIRLFGSHARAFFDLGVPDEHPAALAAVPRIAAQAVLATRYPLAGAVHVNARFRKPLEPQPSDGTEPWRPCYERIATAGAPRLIPPRPTPAPAAVALLVERVRANPRGVIVAGPLPATDAPELRKAVERFITASGYVLLAEATSQLRFGLDAVRPVGAFDALLRSAELRSALRPNVAIEIGAPAVSAQWLALISGSEAPPRIVLPGERPADPAGGASAMLLGPIAGLLEAAAAELEAASPPHATRYVDAWQAAEAAAWAARNQAAEGVHAGPLQEHQVAPLLRSALAGGTLMVGNSNPVRDLDHDVPPNSTPLAVLHQRGAAGIDGLISGAAGARTVLDGPLALLIGDVAALHDAGGLAAAASVKGPLAIVVVHNDGGRIFERLPLGRDPQLAEDCAALFVAGHGHTFDGLAATFDLPYARAGTADTLRAALQDALKADRPMLIEARVASGGSAARSALLAAMAKAGAAALDPGNVTPGRHPGVRHPAKGAGGPPLVLLHGFLGTPTAWDAVLAALPGHGAAWCPFLPGHGPAEPRPDSFEATATWIAESLPAGALLAGYSLGARLALAATLTASPADAPRATLLVGGHVGLSDPKQRAERAALDAARAAELRRDFAAFVDAWEALPLFASQQGLPPEALARQRAARLAHDPGRLAWGLEAASLAAMPDYRAAIAATTRPLCFLTGARDRRFSALAADLVRPPVVTHQIIAGAGHNLLLEAPDAVAAALTRLMETS